MSEEQDQRLRELGFQFSQTVLPAQVWYKPGTTLFVRRPDPRLSRYYTTHGGKWHEFSCPVAAAVWLTVQEHT